MIDCRNYLVSLWNHSFLVFLLEDSSVFFFLMKSYLLYVNYSA